jgi:hypothetical protein
MDNTLLPMKKPFHGNNSIYIRLNGYGTDLLTRFPKRSDTTNKTRKIKKQILAIEAAPAANPPKPRIAAISAITKNIIVQRNITDYFTMINIVLKN